MRPGPQSVAAKYTQVDDLLDDLLGDLLGDAISGAKAVPTPRK
jgi:hypothetical protein